MVSPTITVFGVDHHRTPIALRERLAIGQERLPELVGRMRERLAAGETVVLSTCNRLECYFTGSPDAGTCVEVLAGVSGIDAPTLASHGYLHRDEAGVRHLFRVAAGLESLVLGEEQIVAQVRSAYETAHAAGWTGSALNPLFQRALAVAKDVRSNTALSRYKLSVSSVAVDLARQIHGDLAAARLLVLGAGEMAELTLRYLVDNGVKRIAICNRSPERAAQVAAGVAGATVLPWGDLGRSLADHDIVVASTAAPHAVVRAEDVRLAMARRRSPLVFIDLAVPRDVDPQVGEMDDVYLYNIDHLERVVGENRNLRADEVEAAEARVDEQVRGYVALAGADTAKLLTDVAHLFDDVVTAEAERLAAKLHAEGEAKREIRYGIERATGKLNHRILAWLRARADDPEAERTVREMLNLPPDAR